jgi:hypothetical protein
MGWNPKKEKKRNIRSLAIRQNKEKLFVEEQTVKTYFN